MRLLCDADVDAPLVQHLRDAGHDVQYIAEIEPRADDDQVLELANQYEAILITRDRGFGQMVFRQELPFHGVLLLRLAGVPMSDRKLLLTQAIVSHGHEFEGAFCVLTRNGLRVRPRFPGRGPTE